MKGLDYSFSRPEPARIAREGFAFVMRYLSYTPGKNITPQERDALFAAGLSIGLVWETYAQRPMSGYAGGREDAQAAYSQARALGQPLDRPIYFAVDWDASESEIATVRDYLSGAASILGAERIGVYGSYRVVSVCMETGAAAWGWQTYAWSGRSIYAGAHIYQYSNGEWNGTVDFNEGRQPDIGCWPYIPTTIEEVERMGMSGFSGDFDGDGKDELVVFYDYGDAKTGVFLVAADNDYQPVRKQLLDWRQDSAE